MLISNHTLLPQTVVSKLEEKLAKTQENFDGRLEEARGRAKTKEKEASAAKAELEEVKKKLKESEVERGFLMDTVRKECEERYELTGED